MLLANRTNGPLWDLYFAVNKIKTYVFFQFPFSPFLISASPMTSSDDVIDGVLPCTIIRWLERHSLAYQRSSEDDFSILAACLIGVDVGSLLWQIASTAEVIQGGLVESRACRTDNPGSSNLFFKGLLVLLLSGTSKRVISSPGEWFRHVKAPVVSFPSGERQFLMSLFMSGDEDELYVSESSSLPGDVFDLFGKSSVRTRGVIETTPRTPVPGC